MKILYEPNFNPCQCNNCHAVFIPEAGGIIFAPNYIQDGFEIDCPVCGSRCFATVYDRNDEGWINVEVCSPQKGESIVMKYPVVGAPLVLAKYEGECEGIHIAKVCHNGEFVQVTYWLPVNQKVKGGKTMNESINTTIAPLSEQAKEARRAYQKEWRKNNPDKVKAIQQRHYEKKAAAMQAAAKGKEE